MCVVMNVEIFPPCFGVLTSYRVIIILHHVFTVRVGDYYTPLFFFELLLPLESTDLSDFGIELLGLSRATQ